jgi:hypothetical protein
VWAYPRLEADEYTREARGSMVPCRTRLVKHYTDVVAADGSVGIVYSGFFSLGPWRMRFAAWMLRTAAGELREGRAFGDDGTREPRSNGWTWSHPSLGLNAEVAPLDHPCESTLHDSRAGRIHWRSDAPRAAVRLSIGGELVHGWGYSETLEMTVAPWRVPMQTLRWGRFIADDDARRHLVWIDWRGGEGLTMVAGDAGFESHATVDDSGVRSADRRLDLVDLRNIRTGRLGAGPLAKIPMLAICLPFGVRRLLTASERKYLSRGTLRVGGECLQGWVIHEVVEFGPVSRTPAASSVGGLA